MNQIRFTIPTSAQSLSKRQCVACTACLKKSIISGSLRIRTRNLLANSITVVPNQNQIRFTEMPLAESLTLVIMLLASPYQNINNTKYRSLRPGNKSNSTVR